MYWLDKVSTKEVVLGSDCFTCHHTGKRVLDYAFLHARYPKHRLAYIVFSELILSVSSFTCLLHSSRTSSSSFSRAIFNSLISLLSRSCQYSSTFLKTKKAIKNYD